MLKHITTRYGQPCNHLELTSEELEELEPFLKELGVRCRTMVYTTKDGVENHVIQAENPYKFYIGKPERKHADECMTERGIRLYKY